MVQTMKQYRVTKYNPDYRDANGAYQKDEWTEFSDIGKSFNGHILTADEYYEVEKHYIQMCTDVWEKQGSHHIYVNDIEKHGFSLFIPKTVKDKKPLSRMVKNILENKLWARLVGDDFFLHFGYDYYMYIGTVLEPDTMSELASKYNLYCEEMISPYLEER